MNYSFSNTKSNFNCLLPQMNWGKGEGVGDKNYELKNHLGNVLAVVTDRKIIKPYVGVFDGFESDVVSYSSYYPFGSEIENLSVNSSDYSFGFNGMRKDDEVKGNGNSYDYGARMYDNRLGRWFSLDNLTKIYPGSSPYVFAGNSPIVLSDPDGNILRDKDGNIIITSTGTFVKALSPIKKYNNFSGGITTEEIYRKYENVEIYADDGTPVEALKLVESYILTKNYDAKGKLLNTTKSAVDKSKNDAVSDCHGYTFTGNSLWINDDQVDEILKHDSYSSVVESKSDIVIFKNKGEVIHSAKRNNSGKYDNNAGYNITEYNKTLKEASRGMTVSKTDFYTKNKSDRNLNSLSGNGKNGVAEYSKEEVISAQHTQDMKGWIDKSNSKK